MTEYDDIHPTYGDIVPSNVHQAALEIAEYLKAAVEDTAKRYAQADADAMLAYLRETGALDRPERVVVKEIIRDSQGRITAVVERAVAEADLASWIEAAQ